MIFYHFTCEHHLSAILREGLTRGEIPLSPMGGPKDAVWLTTASAANGHGLEHAALTDAQRTYLTEQGITLESIDKTRIRIRVKIQSSDRALVRWTTFARRIDPQWLAVLHRVGPSFKTWWFYRGVIPPERFEAVEVWEGAAYVPLREHAVAC